MNIQRLPLSEPCPQPTTERSCRSTGQAPHIALPQICMSSCAFQACRLTQVPDEGACQMAPSSNVNRPIFPLTFASRALAQIFTMLGLLQAVCALSLSGLLYQTQGNPLPHVNQLQARYAPDQTGAVASESDICSRIGTNLLQRGGNAADAVRSSLL